MLATKIVSSLTKVYPDKVNGTAISEISALKNEPVSFQVAYKIQKETSGVWPLYARVESTIDEKYISEYSVGLVPVTRCTSNQPDEFYDRTEPGVYPDPLYRRGVNTPVENDGFWSNHWYEQGEKHLINAVYGSWQTLWFTINENGEELPAGKYDITVIFYFGSNQNEITRETITIEIIDKKLPEQTLLYTSWFHCDCLADLYNVEMFSDKHFDIIYSQAHEAAKTGMNMIMLPAFTPPLDTPVGKERPTAQLVGITVENGTYKFDFSLMERYIKLCLKAGMTHFEHSHLFSQWGARSAPKIMATVNGEYKQLFGWDTDSRSDEYGNFLKTYLRALLPFLNEVGVGKNILFHISDEPMEAHIEYYENANNVVKGEIPGYMSGDALSHYKYYENGSVQVPIVAVNSNEMDKFVESCDNYWAYYTGESLYGGYANRIITTTGARNRAIGIQMYANNAKGFLHWGYNYYYDVLSHGVFNPLANPCGYNQLPGTSFMVYAGVDGEAIPSTRMKVQYEGFNDYRALQLLEELKGKDAAMAILNKHFGEVAYNTCPSNDEMLAFREDLNAEIKKCL